MFVRAPVGGLAKTRLAPCLGPEGAAALYAAFVEDVISGVETAGLRLSLWTAGDPEHELFVDCARRGYELLAQPSGSLDERICAALGEGINREGAAMVVGSDAPTLPPEYLQRAAQSLETSELVLGPTHDGGYYLIAARVMPNLDTVRWSTEHALSDTVSVNAARSVTLLPPWYDIDVEDDLRLLRMHLELDSTLAPATRRALSRMPIRSDQGNRSSFG